VLEREATARDVESFLESMRLLGAKCGPLVLQFPYFNRSAFTSSGPFLERWTLPRPPAARLPYGVELRNKSWVGEPLLGILRNHRAALVLVDLAYLPHPADWIERLDPFTADFAYCRLIGDRKRIDSLTDTLDRTILDQGPRLERWAELLRSALERVPETYVYANNHYAGYAPDTIDDLRARVDAPRT
jgi:uncharacterized protein YecE (DUF72 family)